MATQFNLTGNEVLPVEPVDGNGATGPGRVLVTTQQIANLGGGGGGLTPIPAATLLANPTGGSATPVGTPIGNGIGLTGTTVGLAAISATSLLGNTSGSSAVPSAVTAGTNLTFSGSSITTTPTIAAGINYTGGALLQGGNFAMQLFYGNNGQHTFLGEGAGQALIALGGSVTAQNTFVGHTAGQFVTTGGENTYIGSLAGVYNPTGHQSTLVGCGAGWFSFNDNFVTVLGSDAYRNSSSSANGANTAIGFNTIRNGSGYWNTALGAQAMSTSAAAIKVGGAMTTGDTIQLVFSVGTIGAVNGFTVQSETVSIPVTSGITTPAQAATAIVAAINADPVISLTYPNLNVQSAISSQDNTVVSMTFPGTPQTVNSWPSGTASGGGTGAAPTITATVVGSGGGETLTVMPGFTGISNIAIGYQALLGLGTMTTAFNNIAIGASGGVTPTLGSLTTGSGNVVIGGASAPNYTTAGSNVVIGPASHSANITGNVCIAIGINALNTQTAANGHIAIGQFAAQYPTGTTATNIAIGPSALQGASAGCTSFGIVAIGSNSAKAATTANSSVYVGNSAGLAITTASGNTVIGNLAGQAMTTASSNTIYGNQAGLTLISGGNNIIIGNQVAKTTLTTGSDNILIGTDSNTDTPLNNTSNTFIVRGSGASTTPVFSATAINGLQPITIIGGLFGVTPTTGITAHSGGGQASATLLTTGANRIDTVAAANDSVKLPSTQLAGNVGQWVVVTNTAATNSVQLFGSNTDTINGVATGTGVALAAGKTGLYLCSATGAWWGGSFN